MRLDVEVVKFTTPEVSYRPTKLQRDENLMESGIGHAERLTSGIQRRIAKVFLLYFNRYRRVRWLFGLV